ncbi:MAG: DUF4145 domain-containing protein [Nitrospirota bacterium]|nr:DUF4145 domain-containing protein [Nitrospirota bacterium]
MNTCPHCSKGIYFEESGISAYSYDTEKKTAKEDGYAITHGFCPACHQLIVLLQEGKYKETQYGTTLEDVSSEEILYPKAATKPVQPEVPDIYKNDFLEAVSVLNLSPKASAAISRRLLQCVLREELKVKKSSLAKEIDDFLKMKTAPSYLAEAIDAVRQVGNFAAHPEKDISTGEIVDVENGEAEWLLDVLEALFDFTFVQPKRLKQRRDNLNEKLSRIGKPPAKNE